MIGRRKFFASVLGAAAEKLGEVVQDFPVISTTPKATDPWIRIGRWSDFPVGVDVRIGDYLLNSNDCGLMARDADEEIYRSLRTGSDGTIWLNCENKWHSRMCLSMMTGEMIELDKMTSRRMSL